MSLVQLFDNKGALCVNARSRVRFALNGAGTLRDNLGTSTGSRVVQVYNGRAEISFSCGVGSSRLTISSDQVPAATLDLF